MRAPRTSSKAFQTLLQDSRIIPGVKTLPMLRKALSHHSPIIFFLTGTIFSLKEAVQFCRDREALLFAHVDLMQGIGKDPDGMHYLAEGIGVNGILSTRSFLIKAAAKQGLLTIQRLFALDSEALRTGLDVIRNAKPDAVEILPGLVLPSIHHRLPFAELPPVIGGGLLETAPEIEAVLQTPAVAVSTSRPELWPRL